MNKHIAFASIFCLITVVALAATDSHLEQRLKDLTRAPVDYAIAGKWFKIADEIENDSQRQEALMAAGAALIYSKKGDIYQSRMRQMLDNASAFENEFMVECPNCRDGESKRQCATCKGTGKCQYANCNGGRHAVPQFNGGVKYEMCRECKGSGRCQKCNGTGSVQGKCARCGGRGKSMDTELLLASYKKHADAAARWEQIERERREKERLEAEEKARIEEERRKSELEREEMRARGLVEIQGKWMTPGSKPNMQFTVIQKLLVEGVTGIYREPFDRGEYGGMLTVAPDNSAGCVIVNCDEYHYTYEKGQNFVIDLYRCGNYTYTMKNGRQNTVPLYATECEVALEELKSKKYSECLR